MHRVGRAARAVEPALATRGPLVGVVVAIDHPLEHLEGLRVAVEQEETMVSRRVGDGRAGLGIRGAVRQLVVVAEGLALMTRADPPGDVRMRRSQETITLVS